MFFGFIQWLAFLRFCVLAGGCHVGADTCGFIDFWAWLVSHDRVLVFGFGPVSACGFGFRVAGRVSRRLGGLAAARFGSVSACGSWFRPGLAIMCDIGFLASGWVSDRPARVFVGFRFWGLAVPFWVPLWRFGPVGFRVSDLTRRAGCFCLFRVGRASGFLSAPVVASALRPVFWCASGPGASVRVAVSRRGPVGFGGPGLASVGLGTLGRGVLGPWLVRVLTERTKTEH